MAKNNQRYVRNEKGKKVPLVEEDEYRKRILAEARFKGCEIEILKIFEKYDTILRNCGNAQEAKAIATMGVMEVSDMLDGKDLGHGGSLIVDGSKVK